MTDPQYAGLGYDQAELADAMRAGYDDLIDFVSTPAFKAMMQDFSKLAPSARVVFVQDVLLSESELAKRGIEVPAGVLIQRSAFGDRRPTLFCVKTFLPEKFQNVWQNVNITFDNEFADSMISREADIAWRPPLPVALQAELMATGARLDT